MYGKDHIHLKYALKKICESLVQFGYDVTILCKWNNEVNQKEVINGIKIIRAGYQKKSFLFAPVPYNIFWKNEIRNAIEDINPDLIINREFFLMTETSSIAKPKKIPIIMDMAENYPAAMREFKKYDKPLFKLFFRNLKLPDKYEKYTLKLIDGLIVVCDEQKQRIINQYNINQRFDYRSSKYSA